MQPQRIAERGIYVAGQFPVNCLVSIQGHWLAVARSARRAPRMEDPVWKRLLALLVALAASIPVAMLATAAPASAAAPGCNAITATAHWTASKGFNYTPGHWCMKDTFSEVIFQSDGNLVWYKINDGSVLWSSNTCSTCRPGQRVARLSFQTDGNVVVYRNTGAAMWAVGTGVGINVRTTQFNWQVERVNQTCGFSNFEFFLRHFQTSPDHTLNTLSRCNGQ